VNYRAGATNIPILTLIMHYIMHSKRHIVWYPNNILYKCFLTKLKQFFPKQTLLHLQIRVRNVEFQTSNSK